MHWRTFVHNCGTPLINFANSTLEIGPMLYFNILCLYKTNAKQKRSVFSVSVRVASVEDVDPRHVPARHGAAVAQHARRPPQLPHRGLESRDTQFGQQYLLLFSAETL